MSATGLSANELIEIVIVEIPLITSGIVAWFRSLGKTLTRMETRLQIDANEDLARDKDISELKKGRAADHDLLIEWVGWGERHDQWSKERWDSHLRDYHHHQ